VKLLTLTLVFSLVATILPAQAPSSPSNLDVTPGSLTLEVGATTMLSALVTDSNGQSIDEATVVYYSRARRSVGVSAAGRIEAYRPGEFVVVALVPTDPEASPRRAEPILQVEIPVTIPNPPISDISFQNLQGNFYAETTVPLFVNVVDTSGVQRHDVKVNYTTNDESIAEVNRFGHLHLHSTGEFRVTATAETATATARVVVLPNPASTLELTSTVDDAVTGDVVRFSTVIRNSAGRVVSDMPVQYAVFGEPDADIIASGSPAQITRDGRFVAERSGRYTIVSTVGTRAVQRILDIRPRDVTRQIEVVGHGPVRDRHTSDLWIWEGIDGRDYAITGTWGADGHAYIWDVTDPAHMSIIDVVRVDARTVNDVKISEDGRVAVISREGASNRRNGLVLLDVSDPINGVSIISRYDDQLTGGVHNVFLYENHVFALSGGRRYDIINIEDATQPTRIGRFELDTPGHGIHDVWVEEGIAYSSNWSDGIVAVDVGGGNAGGSLQRPVQLGRAATHPNGWNHAAFPYRSQSTGKFYLFGGDEAFPYGDETTAEGQPERAAGWIHVYDWDDWNDPKEVARYQVPEAGTHNIWIENDILYVAYYNGGLRVVDVSGELLGDLYQQGREIAFWEAFDPEGFVKNAPMAWGPQPHKGHIFLADHNSGLWAVRLLPKKPGPTRNLGEPR